MSTLDDNSAGKPIVFISYSHDSPNHTVLVKAFADRLKVFGIDVLLDQYNPDPPDGWPLWMAEGIETAKYVLSICTETYSRRTRRREEPGVGKGVQFEGGLIRGLIYHSEGPPSKFIPVILEGGNSKHIPITLLERNHYEIKYFNLEDARFKALVVHITGRDPGTLLSADAGPSEKGPRVLDFTLRADPSKQQGLSVRLTVNGEGTAENPFDGDPLKEQTIVQCRSAIEAARDQEDDLRYVGTQLWSGLIAGPVGELFRRVQRAAYADGRLFHVRLSMEDRELESLPWEAMYDQDGGFLANQERFCIIRLGTHMICPARPWSDPGRPPGILLVIPTGSGLEMVAREQLAVLRRAEKLGAAIRVETLPGPVTHERMRDAIASGDWDVVHFAGHGRADEHGNVELQLNDDAGAPRWIKAEAFASLYNRGRVRLVLLNCCRGATVRPDRVAALGPMLLSRGVAAVVAMRYEITDVEAHQFADEFYRVLLTGSAPGRVDHAMEAARVAVYQFQNPAGTSRRGFITPSLYLAPNCEQIFPFAPLSTKKETPIVVRTYDGQPLAKPTVDVPSGLVKAIRERLCVPIIGPGLMSVGAVRDTVGPPSPRQLARLLADASNYPESEDFQHLDQAGEWLDGLLLSRVCQHFLSDEAIQHEFFESLEKAFAPCLPTPALLSLTGWDVPGYICLYIDALLEGALRVRQREFAALSLSAEAPTSREITRLVHLCGTWKNADSDDFALSEQQRDQLWDKLAKSPPWLTDLVQGKGRSLLFLGIHPRDPLARRLVSKLRSPGVSQKTGPIYFVYPGHSAVDRAYWKGFKVQWIEMPPAELLAAIDAALFNQRGSGK